MPNSSQISLFDLLVEKPFTEQARQPTSFTCCARDHFVGSRARPLRAEDALVAQAGRLFLCSSGRRSGHILACGEDASSQNVKVKPALSEMGERKFLKRARHPWLAKIAQCFTSQMIIVIPDTGVAFLTIFLDRIYA